MQIVEYSQCFSSCATFLFETPREYAISPVIRRIFDEIFDHFIQYSSV